jgi:hypothetical protein
MIKIASLSIAEALLACGLAAAPAQAGPNRTWVSVMGTDSGACTRAAPCKTFAFALSQTAAGGEIDVVDPGGYGMVTITKAISIVNDGAGAATIGTASGNGVTITAGTRDNVYLRGLTIQGLGSGANGILFNTGGNLEIENCVIRNFSNGINIAPSTSSSFAVSNTIASNNSAVGIQIGPTGSPVVMGVLSKVTANNNNNTGIAVNGAFTAGASLNVTIVDSEASNNGTIGVLAASTSGHAATAVMLRNSDARNNSTGLFAVGAILRVAHSVVTGNVAGVDALSGTLDSYGHNDIDGNMNNNLGALTVIPTH